MFWNKKLSKVRTQARFWHISGDGICVRSLAKTTVKVNFNCEQRKFVHINVKFVNLRRSQEPILIGQCKEGRP